MYIALNSKECITEFSPNKAL